MCKLPSTEEYILSQVEALQDARITKAEVARATNTSDFIVTSILNKHGIKLENLQSKRWRNRYQPVLDFIKENGGRPKPTLRKMGLPTDWAPNVNTYAKEVGFPLDHYAYYEGPDKRHGYWQIVPGPTYPSTHKGYTRYVPAKCHCCGEVYERVDITNLRGHMSLCCKNCVGKTYSNITVTCVDTGEKFNSIRQLVISRDAMNSYQTARRKARRGGLFTFMGVEYFSEVEIIDSPIRSRPKRESKYTKDPDNYKRKLTAMDVVEIKQHLRDNVAVKMIAKQFGVSTHMIYSIRNGVYWKNVA